MSPCQGPVTSAADINDGALPWIVIASYGGKERPLHRGAATIQDRDRTPKAGVAGSNPAGGTMHYRSELGFLSQEGSLLGLGLLVRGRCVSGA